MSQTDIDTIRMKIEQVQRGEVTVDEAVDTIFDWCEKDIEDEQDCIAQYEEDESTRLNALVRAVFTTGTPDLFSDEMRWFWKTE